jgi:hypothetical protein
MCGVAMSSLRCIGSSFPATCMLRWTAGRRSHSPRPKLHHLPSSQWVLMAEGNSSNNSAKLSTLLAAKSMGLCRQYYLLCSECMSANSWAENVCLKSNSKLRVYPTKSALCLEPQQPMCCLRIKLAWKLHQGQTRTSVSLLVGSCWGRLAGGSLSKGDSALLPRR